MTLEEAKQRLMTEEGFRKAYEELEEEYAKIRLDIRRAQNDRMADRDTDQGRIIRDSDSSVRLCEQRPCLCVLLHKERGAEGLP